VRAEDESVELSIEHSITSAAGKPVFSPRGTLFYRDPRGLQGEGAKHSLHTSKTKVAGDDMDLFKKLVDNDGNYLVRVKSPNGAMVSAYARACALVASNFKEDWDVTMDNFGNIVAINYSPHVPDCTGVKSSQLKDHAIFETSAKLAYPWRGIRPEVKSGQGAPPGGAAGAPQPAAQSSSGGTQQGGEPEEEPSFLRKYWLYIAIPVVFLMMQSAPEEGAGGQKAGAGQRAAPRRRPTGA